MLTVHESEGTANVAALVCTSVIGPVSTTSTIAMSGGRCQRASYRCASVSRRRSWTIQ